MKKCIMLFLLFQALDIMTTIIGIAFLDLIELNRLMELFDLAELICFKVLLVTFVTIILYKRPKYYKIYNALWIISALPVLWNLINIGAEIVL